ncbi:MAG: TetR/AcrR family transcriptional regulator [Tepidamorphaceae bacterium]
MREETREQRRLEIEAAAYELLEAHGYDGFSMLSVAKAAKASNETLYRWYGDKQGLFKAMVQRNAADVKALLEAAANTGRPPLETLSRLGPLLLKLLAGNKAIALNRAAAADPSGELGATISQAGRQAVMPLIVRVFQSAMETGALSKGQPEEAAETYLGLLVGDMQVRRMIGAIEEPADSALRERSERAFAAITRLLAD